MRKFYFKTVFMPAKRSAAVLAAVLTLSSCGIGGTGGSAEKETLIPIAAGDTYIYVNNKGEALKPEVNVLETSAFYGDYAVVGKEKKGFIDRSGKLIIPMQYRQATIFSEGLAFIKEVVDSPVIAINTKGEEVFRLPDAYNARRFSEGLAAFLESETRLWGFVNKKGDVVIKPQYKVVGDFSCGLAAAGSKEAYGFINTKGDMVIEPQFHNYFLMTSAIANTHFTADGYCIVGIDDIHDRQNRAGVINTKGEFVIPLTNCILMQADKSGFIVTSGDYKNPQAVYMDVKGKILLEGFARIYPFNGGKYTIAVPSDGKEFVIIDRAGKTVAEIKHPVVSFNTSFIDGMAVAQNGHTLGEGETIINEKGEKIIDEKKVYVANDYDMYSELIYFKLNHY
jgi:hypothetical protein